MRLRFAAIAAPMILMIVPLAVSAQSAEPSATLTASGAPGASADPGSVVFSGSGQGGMLTAPFTLEPGDHSLSYEVRAPGQGSQCGMGFALAASDGTYWADIGNNGAYVAGGTPYRNETWFHVPTAGSHVLQVGGDCDWDATVAFMPSPLAGLPITLTGSGPGTSASFLLGAGDHVVRYLATNPSSTEACIFSGPGIIDLEHGSQMVGDRIDAVVDPVATLEGEAPVSVLSEGRYAFSIRYAWCSSGLAESVGWEVTIDRS